MKQISVWQKIFNLMLVPLLIGNYGLLRGSSDVGNWMGLILGGALFIFLFTQFWEYFSVNHFFYRKNHKFTL